MTSRAKVVLATAAATLAIAAPAHASVTIGSTLASAPSDNMPGCNSVSCTAVNLSLNPANQAPAGLTSPVNGTVVSWRAASNLGVNLALRVLRPAGGASYTGAGTSAVANPGPGVSPPISTSLPIRVGDFIGLNASPQFIYATTSGSTAGAWFMAPGGQLADGSTRAADATLASREVLVQAVVQPSNTLIFGKRKLNRKNGTARMTVTVPNPGQLTFTGDAVKVTGAGPTVAAGDITLRIKATKKKAARLRVVGRVSVFPGFIYTPTNGSASAVAPKVTLRRNVD